MHSQANELSFADSVYAGWQMTGIHQKNSRGCSAKKKDGAVALRKMIQDIVGINHSSILYLVYVLLSATAPS
jgi:hypothetical protein